MAHSKNAFSKMLGLDLMHNPATISAQVRRLPSGQIQLKIPIGRSENPHSVIAQLKKVFGKRIKAVEMTGGRQKRNPSGMEWKAGSSNVDTSKWWPTQDQAWDAYVRAAKRHGLPLYPLHAPGRVSGDGHETLSSGGVRFQGPRTGHGNVYLESRPKKNS